MRQDAFEHALRIVIAQASVRPMSTVEIMDLTRELTANLTDLVEGRAEKAAGSAPQPEPRAIEPVMDPKKSVKDNSVTCLVCGQKFKLLTTRHLSQHGFVSAEDYCDHFGLKRGTVLTCRNLQKMRREKMESMKLWERRYKTPEQPPEEPSGQSEGKTVVVRKRAKQAPAG